MKKNEATGRYPEGMKIKYSRWTTRHPGCVPPASLGRSSSQLRYLVSTSLQYLVVLHPSPALTLFARTLLDLGDRDASCNVYEGSFACAGLGVAVIYPVKASRWGVSVVYRADTLPREGDTTLQQGSSNQHGGACNTVPWRGSGSEGHGLPAMSTMRCCPGVYTGIYAELVVRFEAFF